MSNVQQAVTDMINERLVDHIGGKIQRLEREIERLQRENHSLWFRVGLRADDAREITRLECELQETQAERDDLNRRLEAAERVVNLIATQYPGLSSEVGAALDAWRDGEGK